MASNRCETNLWKLFSKTLKFMIGGRSHITTLPRGGGVLLVHWRRSRANFDRRHFAEQFPAEFWSFPLKWPHMLITIVSAFIWNKNHLSICNTDFLTLSERYGYKICVKCYVISTSYLWTAKGDFENSRVTGYVRESKLSGSVGFICFGWVLSEITVT